jgi:DNA-binding beta-propeller fold protein YncE
MCALVFHLVAFHHPSTTTASVTTFAQITRPVGVAISSNGEFALVADQNNYRIHRIEIATGLVTTLTAPVNNQLSIAISPDSVYALVADYGRDFIGRMTISTSEITTLAGTPSARGDTDGTGTAARFDTPYGIAISSDATFALVIEIWKHRVRKIAIPSGVVTTLAGSPLSGSADGVGTLATFNTPTGIAVSPDGIFALVTDENGVRRLAIASGIVTTLAKEGSPCVAISPDGAFALFFGSGKARRIAISTGLVTTVAGSDDGFVDGTGTSAKFNRAKGVAIAPDGRYALVADLANDRVRRISLIAACPHPGSFCPAGSSAPVACTAGTFCNGSGLSATSGNCAAGIYCPTGSTNQTGSGQCPAGLYCPLGGLHACTAGYYCSSVGVSAEVRDGPCAIGSYCPTGSSRQLLCSIGSYCNSNGLSAVSGPCNLTGYFCPAGSSSAMQMACKAGYFCSRNYFNALGAVQGQSSS